MKIMEIIIFLFIFSLVMNGLSLLRLSSSSFGTSSTYDMSSATQVEQAMTTQISIVLVAGVAVAIVTWIALASIPMGSGGHVPVVKFTGYALFAGLMTTTLFGVVSTLFNLFNAVPASMQVGANIALAIILSIITLVATIGYIELTTEKEMTD